jgi:hypothetical protein
MSKKRSSTTRVLAAAALLLCLPLAALAGEKIEVSRDVNADAVISISNVTGSVTLTGWDAKEIEITGTLGEGSERLDIEGDEDRLIIEVVIPEHARNVEGTHLNIRLPATCRVRVSTVNADIEASDLSGELAMNTVNGDVDVEGNLREIGLNTVSGDAVLKAVTEVLEINNVSGDVDLEGAAGAITISTVSGDIQLADAKPSRMTLSSVSADFTFSGEFQPEGRYDFNSQSGSITLYLGGDLDADFWVSSFSGDIDSDFGGKVKRKSKYGPGKELEFRAGSGDGRVEIETFSGDVEILKR